VAEGDIVAQSLIIFALVLGSGYIASRLMANKGIPESIFMISAGVILGPVTGFLDTTAFEALAPYLGGMALIAIMFDSGFGTDIEELLGQSKHAFILAILSFFSGVALLVFILYILPISSVIPDFPEFTLKEAVLYGTIVGGSSGAVVASVAKSIGMKKNLSMFLTVESILTDALCIIGTLTVIMWITIPDLAPIQVARFIGMKFIVSLLTGSFFALVLAHLIHRRQQYTAILTLLILLYGITEIVEGNGAIAIFVCAVVLGNLDRLPILLREDIIASVNFKKENIGGFHSELSFLIKVFFYLEVGLIFNVNISDPKMMQAMLFGLIIAILLLVVRFPAATFVSRMSGVGESKVISVFYARGLAAAVLAFLPTQLGFSNSDFYLQSIAAIIVFSNVILTIGYPLTTSGIRRHKPKYEDKEEPKTIKDEEERPYGF
jgi:cell volume regulation protein A|tara:strand:- start:9463 stop:10767 length:1305 start_codon:yes stop_codon:yes gene_type:complete